MPAPEKTISGAISTLMPASVAGAPADRTLAPATSADAAAEHSSSPLSPTAMSTGPVSAAVRRSALVPFAAASRPE